MTEDCTVDNEMGLISQEKMRFNMGNTTGRNNITPKMIKYMEEIDTRIKGHNKRAIKIIKKEASRRLE